MDEIQGAVNTYHLRIIVYTRLRIIGNHAAHIHAPASSVLHDADGKRQYKIPQACFLKAG